ncbi:MAG TPA: CBS domain-containing protein [Polyangiaceae bacterium]|jgi:CBS-domain-containing membrane protein|nr:CBS domain-containing protein [Polyangiaceae bacterium]
MNVAFFLTPKSEVVWVNASGTVAQALERMKPNGFGSVPILDDDGGYAGTLSTGDLMWHLIEAGGACQETACSTPLLHVRRRLDDSAVHIDAELGQLIARVETQGFVSVVDDRGAFIGIVRRRPIIEHLARLAGIAAQSLRAAPGS